MRITLKKKNSPVFRLVDLFSGTGAFSYVFEQILNQAKCVFANDFIPESKAIYDLNNSDQLTLMDIHQIDIERQIPEHDILTAGFPCQPFSIAGKRLGFQDSRSNVFWVILEILKLRQPKVIILENVKNLMTHDHGNTYQTIVDNLTQVGYHLKVKVLDTCQVTSIPHHRERIYIVGFLDINLASQFDFDFNSSVSGKPNPVANYLETSNVDQRYYYNERFKVYDEIKKQVTDDVTNDNAVYQYRRYYVRRNASGCCPTLTANMGSGGHNVPIILTPSGIRKLTPRECFNLQGFPSTYKLPQVSDSVLYKLAGNAVSLPIIELIGKRVCEILK